MPSKTLSESSSENTNTSADETPLPPSPSPSTTAPAPHSHIHFSATPTRSPIPRYPSSYTRSNHSSYSNKSNKSSMSAKSTKSNKSQALGTQVTRRTPSSSVSSRTQPAVDFADMLPQHQLKSMHELDKEEELRLANTHVQKVKKMGYGFSRWVFRLTKGSKIVEKGEEAK